MTQIKTILTNPSEKIHPAMDFTEKSYYIGFWGVGLDEKKNIVDKVYFLTSKGVVDEDGLLHQNVEPNKTLLKFDMRFSENFLNSMVNDTTFSVVSEVSESNPETCSLDEKPYIRTIGNINYTNYTKSNPGKGVKIDTLELISAVLKEYIEFPNISEYRCISLWIIGTYYTKLFTSFPYLFLNGLKQSGKTKTEDFLSQLCFNALHSGSITPSAVFRIVDSYMPTMLIDEVDVLAVKKNTPELHTLLLNGYKKGAKVYRTKQKGQNIDFEIECFEVFCPKAIANIKGLDDVLEDRCINITLLRAKDKKYSQKEINENDEIWQSIRDVLYYDLTQNWQLVMKTYKDLKNETKLIGREWELWKPLLTLSKVFGGEECYREMVELSVDKSKEKRTENITEQGDYMVVNELRKLVTLDNYYPVRLITGKMLNNFDTPQKWLTNRWVGRSLKRLNFKNKRRVGAGVEYFFKVDQIKELVERLQITSEEEAKESLDFHSTVLEYAAALGKFHYIDLETKMVKELSADGEEVYIAFLTLKNKGEIHEIEPEIYEVSK